IVIASAAKQSRARFYPIDEIASSPSVPRNDGLVMAKPFAGIRILDFTRYVAGPFGTYQFALLGAEVIKVEPKAGDDMRRSSPVKWEGSAQGLGPSFLGINSNKRSITLDLSKPQAVEIAKRLAEKADIVRSEERRVGKEW